MYFIIKWRKEVTKKYKTGFIDKLQSFFAKLNHLLF
jgi:hypothetical protein